MIFNENQLRALDINRNTAVSAGAGSGKTRVLTSRYIKLLDEGNVGVQEIVAITFTNKAALEMKERIRVEIDSKIKEGRDIDKWLRIKEEVQMANISTIHSFCMNIVRENAFIVGIDPEFTIMDEYQGKIIFNQLLKDEIKKALNENNEIALNIIKDIGGGKEDKLVSALEKEIRDIYYKIRGTGQSFSSLKPIGAKAEVVFKILRELDSKFTRIKYDRGIVDFNDIENMTMEILEREECREGYRSIYKRFLIDEFQDTNELQKKIIYSFVKNENGIIPASLFVVGDHKQAIYGFRGTDFRVFRDVMKDINNTVELDVCYRSKPSIIRGINDSFKNALDNYDELKWPESKILQGDRSIEIYSYEASGSKAKDYEVKFDVLDEELENKLTKIRERKFAYKHERNIDEEASLVAEAIIALVKEGYKLRDMAILLRSRNGLSGIMEALSRANINYVVLGGLGFFDKQEVIDLMHIYKSIISPSDRRSLFGALRSPGFCINDEALYFLNKFLIEKPDIAYALDKVKGNISTGEFNNLKNGVNTLEKIRQGLPGKRVYDILIDILKHTDFNNKILAFKNGEKSYRNIEKLLAMALEFDKNPLLTPSEFCDYIKEYSELTNEEDAPLDTENSDAVKIMTIHASKGLEFSCVIAPYLGKAMGERTQKEYKGKIFLCNEAEIFYSSENQEKASEMAEIEIMRAIDEEKRILYVAATRAKEKLILINKIKNTKSDKKQEDLKRSYIDIFKGESEYVLEQTFNEIKESKLELPLKTTSSNKLENRLLKCDFSIAKRFNFSISRYLDFKTCERKYYYKYLENIPENYYKEERDAKAGYGARLGTAVHEILENGADEGMIEAAAEKSSIDSFVIKRYISSFKTVEEIYLKNYSKHKLVMSVREQEIRYRFKNITFTGFIDRLDVFENEKGEYSGSIIDYKTNRVDGDEEKIIEKYIPQLTLYKLAVRDLIRVKGRRIEDVKSYLFLLNNSLLREISSESPENEFMNLYNEMIKIDLMEEEEEFQKSPDSCSFCGYYKLCNK